MTHPYHQRLLHEANYHGHSEERETKSWYHPRTQQSPTLDLTSYYVEPTEVIDFAEVCLMDAFHANTSNTEDNLYDNIYASEIYSEKYSRHSHLETPVILSDESFISESCADDETEHYVEHVSESHSICNEELTNGDDDSTYDSESETENDDEELLDQLLDEDFAMLPVELSRSTSQFSGSHVHNKTIQDEFIKKCHVAIDPQTQSRDGSQATNAIFAHTHDPFESRYESSSSSSTVSSIQPASTECSHSASRRTSSHDHQHTNYGVSTGNPSSNVCSSSQLSYRHDHHEDIDAANLLERAHERLERQSLHDTVDYLREKLNAKNDEIECLNDQLRRAVTTKCDLVLAQAELEQYHDTTIAKRKENVKVLKQQNFTLLEEYSLKEKELLTELLTLSSKLKDAEKRHRDEIEDMERLHRNQILEKDYQIAQLTVELQTAKLKYETCKQDQGLYDGRDKPRRKTTLKKIFHTQ
jgi:hypothetical protein